MVAIASGQPGKDAGQSTNYYKCRKVRHFAHECREPAKPASQVFIQATHTAAPSEVGDANNEQKEEPAEANEENAAESNRIQENDEEYVEFEMYENEYYTCGSDNKRLFALIEVPAGKHKKKKLSNKLETIGGHSIVNYGAKMTMKVPDEFHNVYVNIANFNFHDMIIGTPFIRAHRVLLDFENDQVVIEGIATPAHKLELEDADGHA
ncbi:hypothetical protein C0989_003660 [Termitomyces sp. Mn162]|nr:hypothetical protein C0989_003660 [Termitomyces sp. Mn162]